MTRRLSPSIYHHFTDRILEFLPWLPKTIHLFQRRLFLFANKFRKTGASSARHTRSCKKASRGSSGKTLADPEHPLPGISKSHCGGLCCSIKASLKGDSGAKGSLLADTVAQAMHPQPGLPLPLHCADCLPTPQTHLVSVRHIHMLDHQGQEYTVTGHVLCLKTIFFLNILSLVLGSIVASNDVHTALALLYPHRTEVEL